MKRWLIIVLLLSSVARPAPLPAQTRVADSLRALLRAEVRPDTNRVRRLQALSNELMLKDLPQAIAALEQALALSRRLPDPRGEGQALIRLGTLYRLRADYDQARRYTEQARTLFMRRADRAGLSTTYLQLSMIDLVQGDPAAALRAALQGLRYAEQTGNRTNQIRLRTTIAGIYVQMGNYQDALPMLRTTLRNAQAQGDQHTVASVLSLLANAYQQQKNWPQALAHYQRAIQLNRRLGDLRSVSIDETSLVELYEQRGDYQQALRHGRAARAAALSNDDAYNLPAAELALARAHLLLGRPDSAIVLAQHGYALSLNPHSNENLRNGSDILAQAYARRGQFEQAYRYQGQWAAYKDSIAGEQTQRKTSALRYGYELAKKQDQIALLTQARQLQAQKAARQRQELRGLLAGLLGVGLLAGLLARNIFLKQRANRVLNEKNDQIAHQRDRLNQTLTRLKATQSQLVQSERMVALAALTAGVAHEIQNPLNFVNNFADVSRELLTELAEVRGQPTSDPALEAELLADLEQNLLKIHQHGQRAGDIVKGMLEHAHADTGQRQAVDLNALVSEYLRLAYHSLLTRHHELSVTRTLDLDPHLGALALVPQEIGRVLLNLFTNAFYAVQQKAAALGPAYQPELRVCTRRRGGRVELHIRDNGTGIPAAAVAKIFDPFFTTKPAGEGTGLGLWLTYDIITKGYGGKLEVHTQEGEYTELVVTLPQTRTHHAPARGAGRVVMTPD